MDCEDCEVTEAVALVAPEHIVHIGVPVGEDDSTKSPQVLAVNGEPLAVPTFNRSCQLTLTGSAHGIYTVAVVSDGHIVSGSCGGEIRVWNPENGQCARKLSYSAWVFSSMALADGGYACGGFQNGLQLFTQSAVETTSSIFSMFMSTSSPRLKIDCLASSVACMCELTNGDIVTNSGDHDLAQWSSVTGKRLRVLQGHSFAIRCLASLNDGNIISGSEDKSLRVWNVNTGAVLATLNGHRSYVLCVTQSPEKYTSFIISGSADRTIRLWDPSSGYSCVRTLTGHGGEVSGVCVCEANGLLVSSSHDCTLRVWDTGTGDCVDILRGHTEPVFCVAVLKDGSTIVSGSRDQTLKIWN